MKRLYTIILLLACIITIQAQKRFYNLTAEDLQIDSVLPQVVYSTPLPDDYNDSIYTLSIKYPEYIDMPAIDIAKYKSIVGDNIPGEQPTLDDFIGKNRKKPFYTCSFCPVVYRNGKYQYLVSFLAELTSKPQLRTKVRRASATASSRYAEHSVLASGKWAKIRVSENGIHKLTSSVIKSAGFSDLSKVKIYGYGGNIIPEKLTESYITEYDDLKEVPTCTVGDKKLFYAYGSVSWDSNDATKRTRNPYSDYGYYFITQSDDTAKTCTEAELLAMENSAADNYHTLYEKDEYAWYQGGRNLFSKATIAKGASAQYILSVPSGNTKARLSVATTAGTASSVEIYFNGKKVGNESIYISSYDKGNEATNTWDVDNVHESDTVKITTTDGGPVRLDYITLTYDTADVWQNIATGNYPAAEYVYNITNQDLHADKNYDMVIIIPTSQKVLAQAKRMATLHEEQDGMKVRIVPADEIYNEFSSGTPDVSAYKRYMKMLYDKADDAHMPKSLLLFGDCAFDNRMLTTSFSNASPDDYLLCYESENSFNEVSCFVSDDFITYLDDDEEITTGGEFKGLPDIGVGRFPVTTADEAKIMVDKTINYAQNKYVGAWQNTIMFLGDDGNQNTHMQDVDDVAEATKQAHPGYYIRKVYWDAYNRISSATGNRYPEVSTAIKQQQANGALIIDYAGHGSATAISHEYVLQQTDFAAFQGNNLPLWVTASCDIMPFDQSGSTIGETAVLNSKGGAVAFYGTARTVVTTANKKINAAFMRYVLSYDSDGIPVTLGEAQRLAKNYLVTSNTEKSVNKMQYALLGDPALHLALPTYTSVVDSINGNAVSQDNMPQLRAGDKVRVSGHIEYAGEKADEFTGSIDAMVRDTEEDIKCKLNDESEADTALVYTDRKNILFHGTSNVKNGDFYFTFAVPKDINYSDGTGLMNIYAIDDVSTESANGAFGNFTVNGSNIAENDSIGPSIYCYLNSPDFTYGGTVNATPFFVAQVTDQDGINSSGAGIGHDMQLIIDGDADKTYDLNDNFTFDYQSYTSGQTWYSIPALSAGKHTLKFRAWDILNNPSTATLEFNVKTGLQPDIVDVYATDNPAYGSTTFVVTHNFAGSEMDIVVEVMDASGRMLWSGSESSTSNSNTTTFTWDLTLDSGAPLQTGIYLYRVKLSSGGSSYATKSRKLLIIQ